LISPRSSDDFWEDFNTLAALQRNVVQFSAAKSYTMQREMLNLLIDGNGKLRSFQDFKQAAQPIADRQASVWLKAEYELTVASAQMAAKWQQVQKNKNTLPLLQFDAILDNKTTHTCRSLDGVTLPVDHWFWNLYFPPNHWGCRSTVRQLSSGNISNLEDIRIPELPREFQTNLAKSGLLYPHDHPYYNGYNGDMDIKILRDEVKEHAIKHYNGMHIQVEGVGRVLINKKGIKKAASSYFEDIKQLQLINVIPSILKKGHLVKQGVDKNNPKSGDYYYYLEVPNVDLHICLKKPSFGEIYFYCFSKK